MRYSILFRIAGLALLVLVAADARAVTMQWSPVGNPGNSADQNYHFQGQFGAVGYSYNIGTNDVTNSQYVEFLNAKDATGADPLGLYNSNMGSAPYGGIDYNASNADGSKFGVISGNGSHPVNYVTWYDAIRFANWLNNGQGGGDTETGAYTLLGGTPTPSNGLSITRNAGATVFLPSQDEWYKAAYYNPATHSYFLYPTSSPTAPAATSPTAAPNSANTNAAVDNLTNVGAYTGTISPFGAFDMGGNVDQWNEALIGSSLRQVRGGGFDLNPLSMTADDFGFLVPTSEERDVGFRLANIPTGYVPEPSSLVFAALGFLGLVAWRLRRR